MKTIYWEIGQELRNILEENNFDISRAIEVGSNNNTTIFNTTDSGGIIISQDYVSYNGELYNERVSEKVKVYHGGLKIIYPNIFCMDTSMQDTSVPISDDNYFVMHNLSEQAYEWLAARRMVVFLNYKELEKDKKLLDSTSDYEFAYRNYTKYIKYVNKNKKIYCLSIMIPHERVRINNQGRMK